MNRQFMACAALGLLLALGQLTLELATSASHEAGAEHHAVSPSRWEGSPAGKAFSERNHQWAAFFLLVIGLAELKTGWGGAAKWAASVLPVTLLAVGSFLLVWSDHEAWPIGALSFMETFFGGSREILQHKLVALCALAAGGIETARLCGLVHRRGWSLMLPLYAMAGGMILLRHDHSDHPEGQQIALHHTVMGIVALTAGVAKFAAVWAEVPEAAGRRGTASYLRGRSNWRIAWACLVLVIGVLLVLYRE